MSSFIGFLASATGPLLIVGVFVFLAVITRKDRYISRHPDSAEAVADRAERTQRRDAREKRNWEESAASSARFSAWYDKQHPEKPKA